MKHSLSSVWSRKWLWFVMLASLPLAPWIVKVSQRYPIRDKLNIINDRAGEGLRARFGPDVSAQISALETSTTGAEFIKAGLSITSVFPHSIAGLAPGASEELTCINSRFGPWLDAFTSASRSGGLYSTPMRGVFSSSQLAALVRHTQSVLSAGCLAAGNWQGAIDRAEGAAHAADAFRAIGPVANTMAAHLRETALNSYELMLQRRPGAEESRHALMSLRSLASSDPVFDIMTLATALNEVGSDIDFPNHMYENAIIGLALNVSYYHNPGNARWAGWINEKQLIWPPFLRIPWTQMRATLGQIRHVVNTEPDILASAVTRDPLFTGTDPIARAVHVYQVNPNGYPQMLTRSRRAVTRRLLLEAAFAARAWRDEHTTWPGELAALVPAYLPDLPTTSAIINSSPNSNNLDEIALGGTPYLPLRAGWIELTADRIGEFLGMGAAMKPDKWQSSRMDGARRRIAFTIWLSAANTNPLYPVLLAEALERRPSGAVTSVTVMATRVNQPTLTPGMSYPGIADNMINEQLVTPIDRKMARLVGMSSAEWRGLCHGAEDGVSPPAVNFKEPYALRVEMVVPDKVYAIWAPEADQPAQANPQHVQPSPGPLAITPPLSASSPTHGLIVYPEGL